MLRRIPDSSFLSTLIGCFSQNGILGKVDYIDTPIQEFLRCYGLQAFFRKTTQWEYEQEWRYVRRLNRCVQDGVDGAGLPVYFYTFNPQALKGVFIR
jgi:hypothetical protein